MSIQTIKTIFKQRTWAFLAGIVIFLAVFAIARILLTDGDLAENLSPERQVAVASVGDLSADASPISTVGRVEARNEAELRTEHSGQVTQVSYPAGSAIGAGSVIARIENSSQGASIAQAKARVATAEANLSKVLKGARDEELTVLGAGVSGAQNTVAGSITTAQNALRSAYDATDSAISLGADDLFHNPESLNARLNFNTSNNQLAVSLGNERIALRAIITEHRAASASLPQTESNILVEIDDTVEDLVRERNFLDNLLVALDSAIVDNTVTTQTTISAHITTVKTSRTTVASALSSLASARTGLVSAQNALTISKEQEKEGVSGARSEDIAAAEAGVAEARASLSVAQVAYEKTLVRTPISGVVSALSIKTGDFVSSGQTIGTVISQGSLEVEVYVTARDSESISVGAQAIVDNSIRAVVTRVAPGVDPVRKQVEVRLGITDKSAKLTHGLAVPVQISRTAPEETNTATKAIVLPLSSIKLTAGAATVFTIENGTLVSHSIQIGNIIGDKIEVLTGIDISDFIVVDARGLSEGDRVTITTPAE